MLVTPPPPPAIMTGAQLLLPVAHVQLHKRTQGVAGEQGQGGGTAGAQVVSEYRKKTVTRATCTATRVACFTYKLTDLPTH